MGCRFSFYIASQVSFWASLMLTNTAVPVTNANVTAPIVDLGYAKYQGTYDTQTNVTSFLGVRYAAPPTGVDGRFKAPRAPASTPGVQPATQDPFSCYVTGPGQGVSALVPSYSNQVAPSPTTSEDCLFLNVFVPGMVTKQSVRRKNIPVLVWIHGGGYQRGAIRGTFGANGAKLIASSLNNFVVVVIQYRLGIFGFLAGDDVKRSGALNAGHLDQTFALQWVQDLIGRFGGDKSHVTIWGESAGAGSVLQHMVANRGNTKPPLFHAAMACSTFLPPQYHYDHRIPRFIYDKAASLTGCSLDTDTFGCLQGVDVETMQSVNHYIASSALYGTFVFGPVVDGSFIVEHPLVTLASGQVNGEALLAVHNEHEAHEYVDLSCSAASTITDYISNLFPDMTSEQVQQAADLYKGYGTTLEQAIMVMGDTHFICPAYPMLSAFLHRAWKALFAVPPAYHGDDLSYYFYNKTHPPPYNNIEFVKAFSQSFMSVAKYYDVNKKLDPTTITPRWREYDLTHHKEMLFNCTGSLNCTASDPPVIHQIQTDSDLLKRCDFWSTVVSAWG